MLNVGPGELLAICVVALIVLGPDKLPQALRTVGRVTAELRRMSSGFQSELRNAMAVDETLEDRRRTTEQRGDDPPAGDRAATEGPPVEPEPGDQDREQGNTVDGDVTVDREAPEPAPPQPQDQGGAPPVDEQPDPDRSADEEPALDPSAEPRAVS